MPLNTETDTGTFRANLYTDNWVSIFAIPEPPYYLSTPVVNPAVIKRDGAEHYDVLISLIGEPELQNVSLISTRLKDLPELARAGIVPRLVFLAHAPLSLFCSDYFPATLSDGTETTTYESLKEAAIEVGRRLASAAGFDAPTPQSMAQV